MSDSSSEDENSYNIQIRLNGRIDNVGSLMDTDSDASNNDNAEAQVEDNSFDTNLPTTHKYMGELNLVRSYTVYDEGEVIRLLSLHTSTLVFPGFTLPLIIKDPLEQIKLENFLKTQNTFVLVCAEEVGGYLYRYGITMEIYEYFSRDNCLFLKAKGRQRCQIISASVCNTGRLSSVEVKILPEPPITSPIKDSQLLSLKLRRPHCTNTYEGLIKSYKHRRYHLAQYPNASWVYDKNEVCFYVQFILKELAKHFSNDNLPQDPLTLSYWFIQNFQLVHEERLELLKLNSTLERLKLECKFVKTERILCCRLCKTEIAAQSKIFAMSKDGYQSNYCNPEGHVFETVTVTEAKNYSLYSTPSKKFSWFPGYAWTIMQCRLCQCHIGWMFTSKSLVPHVFYGLSKNGLDIKIADSKPET